MDVYSLYLIVLRIVHVGASALWVGSAIDYFLFVEPTVKELAPAGPQFMQNFIGKRRVPLFMNVVSSLTVVAGALLFWSTSGGLQTAWLRSGPGIGFTFGSVVALIVYAIGFFLIRPRGERLGTLGREIGMAGGTPSAAQAAELQQLNAEMARIEHVDVVLLMISPLAMATDRYLTF